MKIMGKRWKYINEGNMHIVLQVLETDYVLRLIKEDEKTEQFANVLNSVNFVNKIMNPLLCSELKSTEELFSLPEHELLELSKDLYEFRPENRRIKSVLSPHIIRAPNLAIVSMKCETNYCLEIKPKEGFIASTLKEFDECYYCLKQHLKLQTNQIKMPSSYCPLDLFSGDRNRMKKALGNLIANPQNNFKLFKNGELVYSEKTNINFDYLIDEIKLFPTTNKFLDFVVAILLGQNNANVILDESEIIALDMKDKVYDNENNKLPSNSFLYNLLKLQKISDNFNFNGFKISDMYVSDILNLINTENLNLSIEIDKEKFFKIVDKSHLALISAVAKDCSIMISFSPTMDTEMASIKVGDRLISYKVAVTDLEPKRVKTLSKRQDTERKIIGIHRKYLETSKEVLACNPTTHRNKGQTTGGMAATNC